MKICRFTVGKFRWFITRKDLFRYRTHVNTAGFFKWYSIYWEFTRLFTWNSILFNNVVHFFSSLECGYKTVLTLLKSDYCASWHPISQHECNVLYKNCISEYRIVCWGNVSSTTPGKFSRSRWDTPSDSSMLVITDFHVHVWNAA